MKEEFIHIPISLIGDLKLDPTSVGIMCIKMACRRNRALENQLLAPLSPSDRDRAIEKLKSLAYLNARTGEILKGPKSIEVYIGKFSNPKDAIVRKKKKRKKRKGGQSPQKSLLDKATATWTPAHPSMPYHEFLNSKYWSYIRQIKKGDAGHKCERCGSPDYLQVHHLTYDHRGSEHLHLNDLMVLCKRCHEKEHNITP